MFPGVGSHYTGMGKYFYDNFKVARETFEEAADTLKIDFEKLCFSSDEKEALDKLENSQVALVCVSIAMFRVYMKEIGITPKYCLGYSLGELSALCCAGAIDYSSTLQIVRERGLIINEIVSKLEGTMAWTINLEQNIVDNICKSLRKGGEEVYISAYDSPIKTSISGTLNAVNLACEKVVEEGGISIPIKMSGPFHSPLMIEASLKFRHILENYQYKDLKYPVISNSTALPYSCKDEVVDNLSLQLVKPISWDHSINYLVRKGIDRSIEIGPKNVLKYLTENSTENMVIYSFEKKDELKQIENDLIINDRDILKIIGRCLGVAVSTKNHNYNHEAYQEHVVKTYQEILQLYNRIALSKTKPTLNLLKIALSKLEILLTYKMVSNEEKSYYLENILGDKSLVIKN